MRIIVLWLCFISCSSPLARLREAQAGKGGLIVMASPESGKVRAYAHQRMNEVCGNKGFIIIHEGQRSHVPEREESPTMDWQIEFQCQ